MPESDRRVVADGGIRMLLAKNFAEALRHSAAGWIDDALAFCAPWGFNLADIQVPVLLWHGEDDVFSPAAHARWMAGQIPTADIVRLLLGPNTAVTFVDRGLLELKGLPAPLAASEVAWEPDAAREVRAVLADDSVLFREGVARLLEEYGVRVVAQAGDLDGLLACVGAHRPELAVTDVRMPPTHSTEGVQAAERIRAEHPEVRVLLLSQHAEPTFALRLAEQGTAGFGYLLKERVIDIGHFGRLARRVATGGIAIDAEVVDTLIARQRRRGGLAVLADAELALLRGLAQGEQGDELSEALGIEADGMSEAIGAVLERLGVPAEDQAEPVIASLRVLAR